MKNKNEEVIEIDLLRLLQALWCRVWILIFAMVLGGTLTFAGTALFITPTYEASVLMYVNSSDISVGGAKVSISQGELSAAQSLIDTYSVILETRTTLNDVIEASGVGYTYEELTEMISAEAVNGTEVFRVTVESTSPGEATNIANTIAQVLPEKIASIVEGSSARIVDMAVEPTEKASPSYMVNLAVGILLGFVIAAGIIIVMELMDDKIRESDYLTQTYDLPVLAVIPDLLNTQSDAYAYYKKPARASAKEVR